MWIWKIINAIKYGSYIRDIELQGIQQHAYLKQKSKMR